jgi:hypothetical protein
MVSEKNKNWSINKCPISFAILFMATCLSCNKSDDVVQEKEIHVTAYKIDNTLVPITYNSEGLVAGYGSESVVYNASNNIIARGTHSFGYDGQGRVNKADQTDYTYGSGNLIASVSNAQSSYSLEYNNNNQLVTMLYYEASNATPKVKTLLTYDSHGNISQQLIQDTNNGINYPDNIIISYTYDEQKNPFYKLLLQTGINGTLTPVSIFMPTITLPHLSYYSKNNLVSLNLKSFPTGETQTITYNYTYNADGYPVSSIRMFSDNNGNNQTANFSWNYQTD